MGFKPRKKRGPQPLTAEQTNQVYQLLSKVESSIEEAQSEMALVRMRVRGTARDLNTCPFGDELRALDRLLDDTAIAVEDAINDIDPDEE